MTDEQELLAKFLEFADSDYVPNTLFDRARALLSASKPAVTQRTRVEHFNYLCSLLPEGFLWGDPLMPDVLNHIVSAVTPAQPCGCGVNCLDKGAAEGCRYTAQSAQPCGEDAANGAMGLTDEQLLELHRIARTYNEQGFPKHAREFFARAALTAEKVAQAGNYIDVVFDGPPSHKSGRFVECEDPDGKSINVGEWIDRGNDLWALRIKK